MRSLILGLFAIAVLCASSATADDKWFDMENCAICKNMAEHQELMTEIKWEIHVIDDGFITVAVIPDEHKATMKAAHEKMMQTVAKLEQGETMQMCGFCKSYGALQQAGAKMQEIESAVGMITIVTSDDPELVEKIHKHAKKSLAEHEKMMKEMSGGN